MSIIIIIINTTTTTTTTTTAAAAAVVVTYQIFPDYITSPMIITFVNASLTHTSALLSFHFHSPRLLVRY